MYCMYETESCVRPRERGVGGTVLQSVEIKTL